MNAYDSHHTIPEGDLAVAVAVRLHWDAVAPNSSPKVDVSAVVAVRMHWDSVAPNSPERAQRAALTKNLAERILVTRGEGAPKRNGNDIDLDSTSNRT